MRLSRVRNRTILKSIQVLAERIAAKDMLATFTSPYSFLDILNGLEKNFKFRGCTLNPA